MNRISLRAHAGRALIAFAVLLPAVLCIAAIFLSRQLATKNFVQHLTPLVIADAAILGLGLLLNRGEGL